MGECDTYISVEILRKCHISAKCISVHTFNFHEGLKLMTKMPNFSINYHVGGCDTSI